MRKALAKMVLDSYKLPEHYKLRKCSVCGKSIMGGRPVVQITLPVRNGVALMHHPRCIDILIMKLIKVTEGFKK